MAWAFVKHSVLIAGHLALGAMAVLAIARQRDARQADLAGLRQEAVEISGWRQEMERELAVRGALRQGVQAEDPYAIELLLRTRLGWTGGPAEQRPPATPLLQR